MLFDHIGGGNSALSAYDPERYSTLGAYADDVRQICHKLGLTDVIVVGRSVPAMSGGLAAAVEPERLSKLVFVGPSPRYINGDGATWEASTRPR